MALNLNSKYIYLHFYMDIGEFLSYLIIIFFPQLSNLEFSFPNDFSAKLKDYVNKMKIGIANMKIGLYIHAIDMIKYADLNKCSNGSINCK